MKRRFENINNKDNSNISAAHARTLNNNNHVASVSNNNLVQNMGLPLANAALQMPVLKPLDKALYNAIQNKDLNGATTSIEKGADVNVKNQHGVTLLHYVAQNGSLEIVKLLIANKADVNAKNNNGWTPLHTAAKHNHNEIVETLLVNKAEINATVKENGTSLHIAAHCGHLEVVKTLLDSGADFNIKNQLGLTAFDVARQKGLLPIAKSIMDKMQTQNKPLLQNNFVNKNPVKKDENSEVDLFKKQLDELKQLNGKLIEASENNSKTIITLTNTTENKRQQIKKLKIENNDNKTQLDKISNERDEALAKCEKVEQAKDSYHEQFIKQLEAKFEAKEGNLNINDFKHFLQFFTPENNDSYECPATIMYDNKFLGDNSSYHQ